MTDMSKEEQVRIMESKLKSFDSLIDKLLYMHRMFDPDPEFSKEARDIVRGNIAKELK